MKNRYEAEFEKIQNLVFNPNISWIIDQRNSNDLKNKVIRKFKSSTINDTQIILYEKKQYINSINREISQITIELFQNGKFIIEINNSVIKQNLLNKLLDHCSTSNKQFLNLMNNYI